MRLIDGDALNLDREVELADDWKTAHELANCVKYAPTVDAVPVVRCKECKYRAKNGRCYTENGIIRGAFVGKDWFCADGERRESDTT